MRRLICLFTVPIEQKQVFSWRGNTTSQYCKFKIIGGIITFQHRIIRQSFFLFLGGFTAKKIFHSFETSQSSGEFKTPHPEKKNPDNPKAECAVFHMWAEPSSNTQRWEQSRVLEIWACSWDYGTFHIGNQWRLRRSYTWSMEVDKGFDQKSDI